MTSKKQEPKNVFCPTCNNEVCSHAVLALTEAQAEIERLNKYVITGYEQVIAEMKSEIAHLENERNAFLNEALKYKKLAQGLREELNKIGSKQLESYGAMYEFIAESAVAAYDAATNETKSPFLDTEASKVGIDVNEGL